MSNVQDAYEWLDGNMHRSYPIAASCSCVSNSGVMLPSTFLADIDISVPAAANGADDRFFISAILRHGDSVTVEISYQGANGPILCARSNPVSLSLRNTDPIDGDDTQNPPVPARRIELNAVSVSDNDYKWLESLSGSLIVGSCIDMQHLGNLTFPFSVDGQEASSIISVRVHRVPAGIASVTAVDSSGVSTVIRDNFVLQAGDGVDFDVYRDQQTGSMVLEVFRTQPTSGGMQYSSAADIVNAVFSQIGQPITRINGIAPDSDGNFTLQGDDCTSVEANGNGVFVRNPCAKPCCGDDTPEDVQAAIATLESGMARLQEYYESLGNMVNGLQARLSSLIVSGQ